MRTPPLHNGLALLLPSKGRFVDLVLTLALTPMQAKGGVTPRFVVCANYASWQLALLRFFFSARARFIDERTQSHKGMIGAYNCAYAHASAGGAAWVALWADDLLPYQKDWLEKLAPTLKDDDFHFGIFSSDEGNHPGHYGYNVFGGYPCAHFYVARTDSLPGHLLNPAFRAYTGDDEIAIDTVKRGQPVTFLPVRVIHQPTSNSTRTANAASYQADLDVLYGLHPDMAGKLDAAVLRGDVRDENCAFVPETDTPLTFTPGMADALPYERFAAQTQKEKLPAFFGFIWGVRRLWNEKIVLNWARFREFDYGRIKPSVKRRMQRVFKG